MSTVDSHGPHPRAAPGGWDSPLTARAIAAGAGTLAELRTCGQALYWLESRPDEQGRTTLWTVVPGEPPRELTPAPANVRSRVHEYGGGAFLPTEAGVFYVDDCDGELHHLGPDGVRRRLTDCRRAVRLADFAWDAARRRVLAVCERAPANDADPAAPQEPENLLVAIGIDGPTIDAAALEVLHRGHDFYAAPRLSPDAGRLAFVAWDHPNMPWDGTLLKLAELDAAGSIGTETVIAGGAAEAVQQPLWMTDADLVFVSDANGYWNLYRYDASGVHCLLEDGAEYAEAPWVLGASTVATIGPRHLAAARFVAGTGELVLLDAQRGFATPLPTEWLEYESLCSVDGTLAFIGRRADAAPAIATLRLDSGAAQVIASAWLPELEPGAISHARPRTFRARDGASVYGQLHVPREDDPRNRPGTRYPLLVTVHGGPTARASAALNLRVQYFVSRGWAVLDVDYRGSSGYGRRYRAALEGRWGVLDVADCEDAVRALLNEGIVDSDRIAIRGSSAGGFTVLRALATTALFRAGTSLYGIGDLAALAREMHKFESRYIATLVGDDATCAERSPVRDAARIRAPVLFLQGSDDRVVPPAQARAMVAALRAHAVPVAYLEFPGEGHGFRRAEHIERALESEYAFYCRVFGIESAAPLPPLEIENL